MFLETVCSVELWRCSNNDPLACSSVLSRNGWERHSTFVKNVDPYTISAVGLWDQARISTFASCLPLTFYLYLIIQTQGSLWPSTWQILHILHWWPEHASVRNVWCSTTHWASPAMDGSQWLVWQEANWYDIRSMLNFSTLPVSFVSQSGIFVCYHSLLWNVLSGTFKKLVDINFVGAMGPPGGGRNAITPRLSRHFNYLSFTEMEDSSKKKIFSTILGSWMGELKGFKIYFIFLISFSFHIH